MFTGIIEELAEVKNLKKGALGAVLSVCADKISKDAALGESISINGVCLTVIANSGEILAFDVSRESLDKSNIGDLKAKDRINLEQALKVTSRLGGHFITGHIDCISKIINKTQIGESVKFEFSLAGGNSAFIVSKGSVAVDGISLTVADVSRNTFSVYVIPHTLRNTTLGFKKENDIVNLEFDILAKYVQKQALPEKNTKVTHNFLSEHGFM